MKPLAYLSIYSIHLKTKVQNFIQSSVVLLWTTLLFSCSNDIKEVRDFLADKNLPIGVAQNIYTIYKDSGEVTTIMKSPLLHDFSNRKNHPYTEFPQGVHITKIYQPSGDSTTVEGLYAILYSKTNMSELRGKVVIINHEKKYTLKTQQLFWDQKNHYYFTEKPFTFETPNDTLRGDGFEASEDLTQWLVKNNSGIVKVQDQNVP